MEIAPALWLAWREASPSGRTHCLLPLVAKGGWIHPRIVEHGPWGLGLLRPEHLFGIDGLSPLSHGVLWSMIVNCSGYVIGSALGRVSAEDQRVAEQFCSDDEDRSIRPRTGQPDIPFADKCDEYEKVLRDYVGNEQSISFVGSCAERAGLAGRQMMSPVELVELHNEVERTLAGAIGAPAARRALLRLSTAAPFRALTQGYAELLASLRISPSELRKRVDFHMERERLLGAQADALTEKVRQRDAEIERRVEIESQLRTARLTLEQRVEERTRELSEANVHLLQEVRKREQAQEEVGRRSGPVGRQRPARGRAEIASNILHNVGMCSTVWAYPLGFWNGLRRKSSASSSFERSCR